ncbi:SGNH/GDSL hydrolase family protein [Aeromicrobium sp. NPDC092404]|uniref:SGNH/GDSL hydrolase family protein n=1 Tax=Aeromicrobium sp. NPDC092404 TaxID=3154976 RepID=UPI003430D87A
MMRRWVAVLLVLGCVAACGPDREPSPRRAAAYVGMGDSYVSGPGIAPVDGDSGACLRSGASWPALLARELGIEQRADVSCGGATTDHVPEAVPGQGGIIAPQLDAVSRSTRLVTIGIGGNDGNFYEGLFNSCIYPTIRTTSGCRFFDEEQAPEILAATKTKIVRTLEAITEKAPDADVLLVGYIRILPDDGACPPLGLSRALVTHGSSAMRQLEATQRAAAREAGATFVSLRGMSRGHDVCAEDDAWVNGLENTPADGVNLHPTAAAMRAVAKHLAGVVEARG